MKNKKKISISNDECILILYTIHFNEILVYKHLILRPKDAYILKKKWLYENKFHRAEMLGVDKERPAFDYNYEPNRTANFFKTKYPNYKVIY